MRVSVLFVFLIHTELIVGKTAVLILARGGSKGVRLKNLQTVGGLSLLCRAVRTAKSAGFFDVTVSTDHPLIALEAVKCGAETFHRSYITASDWAPSIWGAAEFIASRSEVEILVLIQATSPLLRGIHLCSAIQRIDHPIPYDCTFAVTRSHKLRWDSNELNIYPANFKINARPRRQDWNGELFETGAFYITRRHLIEEGYFQNKNCTALELSFWESLEVDSYHDLKVADVLLSSNLV